MSTNESRVGPARRASRPAVVGVVRQESVGNRWFGRHIELSEVQTGKGRAVEDELGGGGLDKQWICRLLRRKRGRRRTIWLVVCTFLERHTHILVGVVGQDSVWNRWFGQPCCTVGSTEGEEGAD